MTDGILRKADLPVVETDKCRQQLEESRVAGTSAEGGGNAVKDFQFICAGGEGTAESCYVSTISSLNQQPISALSQSQGSDGKKCR